jgi:hypothetical protein
MAKKSWKNDRLNVGNINIKSTGKERYYGFSGI